MAEPGLVGVRTSGLPLVGRDPEIATAVGLFDDVADGFGHAVVVSGPTGIGKTRLVEEIVRLAEDRGLLVMRGASHPTDRSLLYAPILQAVGEVVRSMEAPQRAKLLRGLESVGLVLEDLGLGPPPSLGDPGLEKTRLFESMVRLIERLAEQRPLLLAIEDLHWADDASFDLISYLIRDLSSLPVMMVATFTTEGVGSAPSSRLLNELRTTGTASVMELAPLTTDETAQLVGSALGGPLQTHDVEVLTARTAGTPLLILAFLDEMMRSGDLVQVEGRWGLVGELDRVVPLIADDVFLGRLSRLDPEDRSVLETVAVGGDEVSHDELRAVTGLEEEELVDAVQRLALSELLAAEDRVDGVTYRCAHPLIAQVAYEHTAAATRSRLHADFIHMLEAGQEDPGSRLVWHYQRAGSQVDQGRRFTLLSEAARRALESYANQRAVDLLGTALDLARSTSRFDVVPQLLEDLGEALQRTGEERAAIEIWGEAAALVDDDAVRARLQRRLASAESNLGHFERARIHVAAGVGALAGTAHPELGELYATEHLNSFREGDVASAAAGVEAFTDLAARLGSPRLEMSAALLQVGLLLERARYTEARREAWRALELARETGDLVSQQQALSFLALVDASLGDLDCLDQRLQVNLDLTEEIGIALREYRIRLYQFTGHVYAGRWDQADDVTVEAALLATRIESSRNRVVLMAMPALLDMLKGDFQGAEERLRAADRALAGLEHAEPRLHVMLSILGAWTDLEAGRPEQALAKLERLDGEYLLGLLPPWGLLLLGEAQARVGAGGWEATADRLSQLAPSGCLPSVWGLRIAALAAGDPDGAADLWARTGEGFDRLGMPFEAARAWLEQAERSHRLGRAVAVDLADECHAVFARLGAARYKDRAARLLRSLGRVPPVSETSDRGPLSRRQLEVARLVAEGLSNADIADRLFISRRTVTTHLENIYRDLGIGSRTALTRYVLEQDTQPGPVA